ncbi:class I SAM-dependent methyltransferase [Chryseobacterium sp. R2A-55]|uniref:class I SAM-dependent methyltransferase n=1 Tax=Chryseobacterium sp. R2A-55 TaxID=2744445 RepID=UPI001F47142B|nr:class I SAM-dependent methyltransferase [Chryseobacterium sp. R2A-55]
MIDSKKEHWEKVFATKAENEVSWYQEKPETSIKFFRENNIAKNAKILEIGGGDSHLIDHLLEMGYEKLTLLDISGNALERIKKRLGEKAKKVNFVISDILDFQTDERFDVVHDRASFHFITQDEEKVAYKDLIADLLSPMGLFFVGTFSENGPLKCSGLEITQYSESKFENLFSEDFDKLNCFTQDHKTPFETIQNFIFCTFKKK